MEWLNIHVSTLDSEAFLGAEPTDRATWLCLLRYCIGQENGGRILECSTWGDRKWQQLCRVTLGEVKRESDLWYWEEFNLVVNFYPASKEAQVRANRNNGALGGRPTGARDERSSGDTSSRKPDGKPSGKHVDPFRENGREGEGNGKEGKGREVTTNDSRLQNSGKPTAAVPPDPSHGSPQLTLQLIESFRRPGTMIMDVLRHFHVAFDLKGERLEDEWREVTNGQGPAEVALVFVSVRNKSVRLPSQYRKARQSYEFIVSQGAA